MSNGSRLAAPLGTRRGDSPLRIPPPPELSVQLCPSACFTPSVSSAPKRPFNEMEGAGKRRTAAFARRASRAAPPATESAPETLSGQHDPDCPLSVSRPMATHARPFALGLPLLVLYGSSDKLTVTTSANGYQRPSWPRGVNPLLAPSLPATTRTWITSTLTTTLAAHSEFCACGARVRSRREAQSSIESLSI